MRVVVFSDVHANWQMINALSKRLTKDVSQVWSLGDMVGYGDDPVATLEEAMLLWEKYGRVGWGLGNHDDFVLSDNISMMKVGNLEIDSKGFNGHARQIAVDHRVTLLNSGQHLLEWMRQLNFQTNPIPGVYLAHGAFYPKRAADSLMEYTRESMLFEQQFQRLTAHINSNGHHDPAPIRILALGHTHQPCLWQRQTKPDGSSTWRELPLSQAREGITLEDLSQQPIFFNPGSLGRPRPHADGPTKPSYVSLDLVHDDEVHLQLHYFE